MSSKDQAEEIRAKAFWSKKARLNTLRMFLLCFVSRKYLLSPETVCDILQEGRDPDDSPKPRAMRDFMKGTTADPQNHGHLSLFLRWTVAKFADDPDADRADYAKGTALLAELEAFENGSVVPPGPTGHQPWKINPPSMEDIAGALRLVGELLHLRSVDFDRLVERVFHEADEATGQHKPRHFLCYRYHSDPGKVVKSFLVLFAPVKEAPGICRFANFFQNEDEAVRQAGGIVLPMTNATYLIGQIQGGLGLKVVVTRDLSRGARSHDGLVLSFDDDLIPIAGRIVLLPTDITHSKDANIGIFEESTIDTEIANILKHLRNRVNFTLREPIFLDGDGLDQPTMVSEIAKLLRDPETKKPRLTYKSGKPFNPAAGRDYTFNSALRMWTAGERE